MIEKWKKRGMQETPLRSLRADDGYWYSWKTKNTVEDRGAVKETAAADQSHAGNFERIKVVSVAVDDAKKPVLAVGRETEERESFG